MRSIANPAAVACQHTARRLLLGCHAAGPHRHRAATQWNAPVRFYQCGSAVAASSSSDSSTSGSSSNDVTTTSSSSSSSAREGRPLDVCVGPGFQLMEQEYSVAGRVLRLLAPIDVDAVMDMYIAAGIDGDPYWCRAWPSAISLAQQLLQRPELVAGKKVADLGAGLGVAGIAAALAGAAEVVLLDREPLALQCALLSGAASGLQHVQGLEGAQLQRLAAGGKQEQQLSGSNSAGGSGAAEVPQQQPATSAELLQLAQLYVQHRAQQLQRQQPQAKQCTGGSGAAETSSSSSSSSSGGNRLQQQQHSIPGTSTTSSTRSSNSSSRAVLRASTFDWSSPAVPERFDVVLACDVLYEDTAVEPVAAVVSRLLKRGSGSSLLLADPPNRTAANRQRFVELLSGGSLGGMSLRLEESGVYQCDVSQLDAEMRGGVTTQSVGVQFMAFRAAVGNDTIGIKLD
ncbi:hypothetical protein COO60DRAFT_176136 [Scenedesmus sp. NREL 46B-D3]|nr:hypothetical protein COO60DRAFT_176136 [Scenedesmus sp. NREL 46B-D3]